MGVDREEAANMRITYLQDKLDKYNKSYRDATTIIDAVFIEGYRKDIRSEIVYLQAEVAREETLNEITDSDIARAREYPINQIIELDRSGRALAWCHTDTNPSLSYWKEKNNVRCFTCNKSFDSISAAMELWGLSFVEAVKQLSR